MAELVNSIAEYLSSPIKKTTKDVLFSNELIFGQISSSGIINPETVDNLDNQTRIAVNITHEARGYTNKSPDSFWVLAYVTLDGIPIVIVRNVYDDIDSYPTSFVVDGEKYKEAVKYLNSFKTLSDVIGIRDPYLNNFILGKVGSINYDVEINNDVCKNEQEGLDSINFSLSRPNVY